MNAVASRTLRWMARRLGCTLERYRLCNDGVAVRGKLLGDLGIDLVLDIGANEGQYAGMLRETGYTGRIISFEPVSGTFEQLERAARGDDKWECRKLALGERDGTDIIGVNNFSPTSSLLPMNDAFRKAVPHVERVREETIEIARLDTIWNSLVKDARRVFMKLDVQGYERSVLNGAKDCIEKVQAIDCELSFGAIYEGQVLFLEIIAYLDDLGLKCFYLDRTFCDQTTGRVLEMDGLFVR